MKTTLHGAPEIWKEAVVELDDIPKGLPHDPVGFFGCPGGWCTPAELVALFGGSLAVEDACRTLAAALPPTYWAPRAGAGPGTVAWWVQREYSGRITMHVHAIADAGV